MYGVEHARECVCVCEVPWRHTRLCSCQIEFLQSLTCDASVGIAVGGAYLLQHCPYCLIVSRSIARSHICQLHTMNGRT